MASAEIKLDDYIKDLVNNSKKIADDQLKTVLKNKENSDVWNWFQIMGCFTMITGISV